MSGRGSQKTCPVLVNYFARELPAGWRYDQFRIGHNEKVVFLLCGVREGRCEKKLFENLMVKAKDPSLKNLNHKGHEGTQRESSQLYAN